jgi:hypothetical protein
VYVCAYVHQQLLTYRKFIYEFVIRKINAIMAFLPFLISTFFLNFGGFTFTYFVGGLYELKSKVLSEEYFRPSIRLLSSINDLFVCRIFVISRMVALYRRFGTSMSFAKVGSVTVMVYLRA